jgi:predicted nucleic acid-binding protein
MANSWVCVDASLVIKLVVEETYSSETRTLWREWFQEGRTIAAPPLLRYEVTSVLRKHVTRGLRTAMESRNALKLALAFDIQYIEPANFHQQAFDWADTLGRPATYDTHYLALAEHLACDFWTADERLVNAVQSTLPWVKWLGQIESYPPQLQ